MEIGGSRETDAVIEERDDESRVMLWSLEEECGVFFSSVK